MVLYSAASIGPVAPVALPAPLSVPSVLTMTQLLPIAPAVVVKAKLAKFEATCICADVRPMTELMVPEPLLKPTPGMAGFKVTLKYPLVIELVAAVIKPAMPPSVPVAPEARPTAPDEYTLVMTPATPFVPTTPPTPLKPPVPLEPVTAPVA